MSIIVAGKLTIKSELRNDFVQQSLEAIALARKNEACEDFSVSPDPLDINRVNIFEKWKSKSDLQAFRDSGTDDDLFSLVDSFDVAEYEVDT